MTKKSIINALFMSVPLLAMAQAAPDAYQLSQTDLRGTARFSSMAGAFGALGGDLSVLSQNPGGIGVYRSSDVGFSLNFDNQSVYARSQGESNGVTQTKVSCSNAGYVGAYKLNSDIVPNINWGFTYSRPVSFNRRYSGTIPTLNSSLSNYVASGTNNAECSTSDLAFGTGSSNYNPYLDSNSPWLSILAYDAYMITPTKVDANNVGSDFVGLMGNGTTGFGEFETVESGGIDEFNMNFGGNVANVLYWGLGVGISDMQFDKYTYYGESLDNAYVTNKDGGITAGGSASYGLENWVSTTGTGYNFKLGAIFKPVNELRLGFAVHTPTYWSLKDEYAARVGYSYRYDNVSNESTANTNNGYTGVTDYDIQTPWKFIASVATVLGQKAILSLDYEYNGFADMKIKSARGEEYVDMTQNIKDYYKSTNTFRVGAEYRITPSFSARLGYSYQNSPVKDSAYNDGQNIVTSGTTTAYTFDKSIQYYTCGFGYKYKGFYTDLALVHKYRQGEYHAFSPEVDGNNVVEPSPTASIHDNNNQIVWTLGMRF